MNISTTKHNGGFMSRFMATAALFVVSLVALAQANVLKIEDFKVIPGTKHTVEVILDNPTRISSLQFDMILPDGLTPKTFDKVTTRISRSSHTLMMSKMGVNKYRLGFLSNATDMKNSAIKGDSGAFATLTFEVDEAFAGGEIMISDVVASNGTVGSEDNDVDINDYGKTKVSLFVGTMSFAQESVTMAEGEQVVVGVNLDNKIAVSAIQANITLPEGVEFAEGTEGEWFEYTDRLSQNTTVQAKLIEGRTYRLVISSLSNDEFEGFVGELFGINLIAKGLKTDGVLAITDIIGTNAKGVAYDIDDITLDVKAAPTFNDPTQDGVWNIHDVYSVINAILSDKNAVNDVNKDGVVNIQDVYFAIDKTLN